MLRVRIKKTDVIGKEFLVLIRSNEDTFNVYDDKGYKFNSSLECDTVFTLTTNAGKNALKGGFKKYNKNGVAIIKSDQIMLNAFN